MLHWTWAHGAWAFHPILHPRPRCSTLDTALPHLLSALPAPRARVSGSQRCLPAKKTPGTACQGGPCCVTPPLGFETLMIRAYLLLQQTRAPPDCSTTMSTSVRSHMELSCRVSCMISDPWMLAPDSLAAEYAVSFARRQIPRPATMLISAFQLPGRVSGGCYVVDKCSLSKLRRQSTWVSRICLNNVNSSYHTCGRSETLFEYQLFLHKFLVGNQIFSP